MKYYELRNNGMDITPMWEGRAYAEQKYSEALDAIRYAVKNNDGPTTEALAEILDNPDTTFEFKVMCLMYFRGMYEHPANHINPFETLLAKMGAETDD